NDAIGDYSEPYAVPLGAGASTDAQFIVFDSSLVGIAPLAASDPMFVTYRAQLERAFALAARRPNTFFMNHHPVLAFAANPARPGAAVAYIVASSRFGFMTMERDGARWRMLAHDVHGRPMLSCTLFERKASCEAIAP